jgi:hypothetical protein
MKKTNNIIMIAVAAAVLVAVNVGVFMAAGNGTMTPINNVMLWGGFVVLNVASILWAVSLLGLQPLVVTVAYVAGGALAFLGVRGMSDISVAEITTAGATYGAFGALAVGNATTKVRLAFFNKGQVPFIFIIIGLLVVDAGLNSQVSQAGMGVLLNAVAIPFIISGVVVGLVWGVLNRFGVGKKPSEVLAEKEAAMVLSEPSKAAQAKKAVIPMPAHAVAAEAPPVKAAPAPKPAKKIKKIEPIAPAVKAAPAPKPAPVAAQKKEEFFPLEIDKGEADIIVERKAVKRQEPEFEIPTFDAALYSSGSSKDRDGGVMVEEPPVVAAVEVKKPAPVVKEPAPVAKEPVPVVAEAKPEPQPAKAKNNSDWLGGHLDLLNKLK